MNVSGIKSALPLFLMACLASPLATAEHPIRIEQGWIRLLPGDLPLAGYFRLINDSGAKVTLVGAESKDFDGTMLHRAVRQADRVGMKHVTGVDVPPGASLDFAPGNYHLMLMGRRRTLGEGDNVAITLRLEDGREVTADFAVRSPRSQ